MSNRQLINQLNTLAQRGDIPADARKDLEKTVEDLRTPLEFDAWIYRAVVIFLGLLAIIAVFGALYTTAANKTLPESVVALGSTAVGALAGLLAPSPRQR